MVIVIAPSPINLRFDVYETTQFGVWMAKELAPLIGRQALETIETLSHKAPTQECDRDY